MSDEPRAVELLERGTDFPAAEFATRWETPPTRELVPITWVRTELPLNIQPERWAVSLEVRELELPQQLYKDLHELTPQAILRDLHRPVSEFFVTPEPIEGTDALGALHVEMARVREARRFEPAPPVAPIGLTVREEQDRRRRFLATRWEPIIPDDAPRHGIGAPAQVPEDPEDYRPDWSKYGR